MTTAARRVVVAALVELAKSPGFRDRADAGRVLAVFGEGPLLELVLDPEDTYVTRATVQTLLQRQDRFGLALVAAALAVADDNHADWIDTAVHDVFRVVPFQILSELTQDPDEQIRRGAELLVVMLTR